MFKSENTYFRIIENEAVVFKKIESQENSKLFDDRICYVSEVLKEKLNHK